jgi:hypothetical protein
VRVSEAPNKTHRKSKSHTVVVDVFEQQSDLKLATTLIRKVERWTKEADDNAAVSLRKLLATVLHWSSKQHR